MISHTVTIYSSIVSQTAAKYTSIMSHTAAHLIEITAISLLWRYALLTNTLNRSQALFVFDL